jgi:5-methylcytosine-specific restriction enzyme subunit McrC
MAKRPLLHCLFDDFTANIVENQVLAAAARFLAGWPDLTPALAGRVKRLMSILVEVEPRIPPAWERRSVHFDRLNDRYRPALTIADWIISRSSPELMTEGRQRPFHSFLVDMSRVFEKFVAHKLRSSLAMHGYRCDDDNLDEPLDEQGRLFWTTPDIEVRTPAGELIILDTKYKELKSGGPEEGDVYQVVTYCVSRGASRAMLVYPRLNEVPDSSAIVRRAGVRIDLVSLEMRRSREELAKSVDWLVRRLVDIP